MPQFLEQIRLHAWGPDLDEKLSWEKHIEKICSKVSAGIGAMRRIKPYVPPATLQTI